MKPKTRLRGWSRCSKDLARSREGVDCPGIDGLISEADEVEVDDKKALNTEAAMAKSFLVR